MVVGSSRADAAVGAAARWVLGRGEVAQGQRRRCNSCVATQATRSAPRAATCRDMVAPRTLYCPLHDTVMAPLDRGYLCALFRRIHMHARVCVRIVPAHLCAEA